MEVEVRFLIKLKDKLLFLNKKKEVSPKKITAQQWLQVKDIKNNIVIFKDMTIAKAIKITPKNIFLLANNEKDKAINLLFEAFNSVEYTYQIFILPRPVDLDSYIAGLEQKKQMTNDILKRKLYQGDIVEATNKATSGKAIDRDFYIIIVEESEKNITILNDKVKTFAIALDRAELPSKVCNEQELRDLNFAFTHPSIIAYEKSPQDNFFMPTLYEGSSIHG
jgi:hypothetical protein